MFTDGTNVRKQILDPTDQITYKIIALIT